jgi:transcription elongation factor GreA
MISLLPPARMRCIEFPFPPETGTSILKGIYIDERGFSLQVDQEEKNGYSVPTMAEQKEYVSREKYQELQKELETLMHTRRKEIAEKLEAAKALGDLSENAEYHAAREEQAGLEERIMELELILKNAQIVSKSRKDVVGIGSKVVIEKSGKKFSYAIVGSEETNVSEGKISNKSPLGESLIGKKKGESFAYTTPSGEMHGTLLEVD